MAKLYFQEISEALIVGARHVGKTALQGSYYILRAMFNFDCQIAHLAAEKSQAKAAFRFASRAMMRPGFNSHLVKAPTQVFTEFKNGSSITLKTGSIAGVNSAHVNTIGVDEIDQLGDNNAISGADIFSELVGMKTVSTSQLQTQQLYVGSWKHADGIVANLVGAVPVYSDKLLSPLNPANVFFITPLDVMRPCLYDCGTCRAVYNPTGERSFFDYCQGRAKNADGWIDPSFYIDAFPKIPPTKWKSQYEAREPDIDFKVHPWFTTNTIQELKFDPNKPLIIGLDYGIRDQSVAIFAQKIGERWHNLGEYVTRNMVDSDFVVNALRYCFQEFKAYPSTGYWWGDPAAKNGRLITQRIGKQIIGKVFHVKKPWYFKADKIARHTYIATHGEKGLILTDPKCRQLIAQLKDYAYKDNRKLRDGGDDAIDAFSYAFAGYHETYTNEFRGKLRRVQEDSTEDNQ